jgi:hypothetical protein
VITGPLTLKCDLARVSDNRCVTVLEDYVSFADLGLEIASSGRVFRVEAVVVGCCFARGLSLSIFDVLALDEAL